MKVCVVGYGHFATTVATSLALDEHNVEQFDLPLPLIREGQMDKEPSWPDVTIRRAQRPSDDVDCVWIAYDTPLDASGRGDVDRVLHRAIEVCGMLKDGSLVLLSSQWPVGTSRQLTRAFPHLTFGYVVENIRVGHALDDFRSASAVIVGSSLDHRRYVTDIVSALTGADEALSMSLESAELSKHALNAFLALQIAFSNEMNAIAERVGAGGDDVFRAVMSDRRVSPCAPLKPGGPFGGGSLQRDVITLNELAAKANISTPILSAIIPSNDGHRTKSA